jgi:glycosyltransferase involved in cell wall biosynthesis
MKLSIALIVKNEEDTLDKCLGLVKGADEIIVVDTGSTDQTIEITKKYTDKIYHFKWVDDFSKARNYAISKCTGDWILSIDADHELTTPIKEVKKECEKADKLGHKVCFINSGSHWRGVLFRNDTKIYWVGAVHENLNTHATYKTKITRRVGYSKNHQKDPERNIRILQNNPITLRSKFYLGRENFERNRYDEAIKWMREYLKEGKWTPEVGEAWITIAKCHWFSNRGNEARSACLSAIGANPDFKEALMLMSEMTYEPLKTKWLRLAKGATNQDVLFVRCGDKQ